MSSTTVFLLGATGYIGGSVLVEYKRRHPDFSYTVLVRNPKDNAAVAALGVKVVQGSHEQLDLIEKLAAEHDVTVNTGDSDDLPLTEAILRGQKARAQAGGRKPIFIHTSGTSVVANGKDGSFHPETSEKKWDDNSVEDIKSIAPTQLHRDVDLTIFATGNSGLIDAYIITPSTIYGKGRGPVRLTSVQVPEMIRVAAKRRELIYIGAGTNIWNSVYIEDLMKLYGLVFDLALSGKDTNTDAFARFYFGASAEFYWGDVAKALAKLLRSKGLVDSPEPKSVTRDDVTFHLLSTGTNSRAVANRGYALGWKPEGPTLFETLEEEIAITVPELL